MSKRVAIMGGTFDPVHVGHLRTAEEAIEELGLEKVIFVPAAEPPHKPGRVVLEFEHRWRMLELSIAENPRFLLSDLERRIPGKSYTINSLRKLEGEFPGAELFFLVGLDAFLEIDTWFRFVELFRLARMVVLRRPGFGEADLEDFLSRRVSVGYKRDPATGSFKHPELFPVHYLQNTRLDISSTRIRRLAAEGRSIRYLVHHEVLSYIYQGKFYGDGGRL
jgi:nicotinate-nucleotide adenylyltransferase